MTKPRLTTGILIIISPLIFMLIMSIIIEFTTNDSYDSSLYKVNFGIALLLSILISILLFLDIRRTDLSLFQKSISYFKR
jgi:hypothetical protein